MRALEAIALKHRECEASLAQLQREVERARGQIADLSAVNTRLLKMDPQPALQEREPEREQPTRMKSAPR